MQVALRLDSGVLTVVAPGASLDERRQLDGGAGARFAAWAEEYRKLRVHTGAEARLLALGRDLYAWLDGGERWLERLLAATPPPVMMEFPMIANAYEIVDRMGLLEGMSLTGNVYGRLLIARGDRDKGLAVLRRCEADFRTLQRFADADGVAEIIRKIEQV